MKTYYGIIGAGGYGREVIPIAKVELSGRITSGEVELVFVVEDRTPSQFVNGYHVLSLEKFRSMEVPRFFNIAIGNSDVRCRISEICINAGMKPFSIFAPNSVVMDGNLIDEGAIFSPFSTITSNARIGKFFHANIYSYIAHDCYIGNYVTFAPSVKCNGNVVIGDHAYLGTGAIIKQGKPDKPLIIGDRAVVGMGAVVTKNVPNNTIVIGNPARPLEKK